MKNETREMLKSSKQTELDRAKRLITEFCVEEYGIRDEFGDLIKDEKSLYVDFSDLSHVDIAYTTDAETDASIQIYADLVNYRIVSQYDGIDAKVEQYASLAEMNDKALSCLEFDRLVCVEKLEEKKKVVTKQDDRTM